MSSYDDPCNANSYAQHIEWLRASLAVRPLRTVDLADAIYDLVRQHATPHPVLAHDLGIDPRRVADLYRSRRTLAPEILAAWRSQGDAIPLERIISVAALPRDEQAAAWNRACDYHGGARRGSQRRPGPSALAKMLDSCDRGRSPEWRCGARAALLAALGREPWPLAIGYAARDLDEV